MLLLLAFPLATWSKAEAAEAAPTQTRGSSSLQASFDHFRAGRYEEAVISAKVALEADPNLAGAYNNLAVSYLMLGRFDEAERAAHEAIRIDPEHQLAKNNLAWIEHEKSKSSPEAAAKLADAAALLNQSLEDAKAGRFKECVDAASRSAKLNPRSTGAFNNLGFCKGSLQLWDAAVQDLEEAIRLDPANQLAKNNLAWVQAAKIETKKP